MTNLVIAGLGGAAAIGPIGAALIRIGVGAAVGFLGQALQGKQSASTQPGIRSKFTGQGDVSPQTIILGRYATAGHQICPMYAHSRDPGSVVVPDTGSGTGYGDIGSGDFATFVINIADAPITGLRAVFVDGLRFDLDTHLGGTAHGSYGLAVASGVERDAWRDRLWVKFYDGTQTQADPYLLAAYGGHAHRPWKSSSIHSGGAYAIITVKRDNALFRGTPQFLFEVDGMALPDTREDETGFTTNAVQIAAAITRGITMPDGRSYGMGVAPEDMPQAWWHEAQDACDELVVTQAGGSEPAYRAGIEIAIATPDDGGSDPLTALDELLPAASARIADLGGQWIARAGPSGSAVLALRDEDILNSREQSYSAFATLQDTHNAVAATFPNPDAKWEATEAPLRVDPVAEAEDGQRLIANLDLTVVPYSDQVQRLMVAWLKDAQRRRVHTIFLPPRFDRVTLFDSITLTSVLHGYLNKLFEVVEYMPDLRSGAFRLVIREVDPADFTPALADYHVTPAPVGDRPAVAPLLLEDVDARPYTLTDGTAPRRPAIELLWTATSVALQGVGWEVYRSDELVNEGSTALASTGRMILTEGIVPNLSYRLRLWPITDGQPVQKSDWITVQAPNTRIGADDLADSVTDQIDSAQSTADAAAGSAVMALLNAAEVQSNLAAAVDDLTVDYSAAQLAAQQAAGSASAAAQSQEIMAHTQAALGTGNLVVNGEAQFGTQYFQAGAGAFALAQGTGLAEAGISATTYIEAQNTGTASDDNGSIAYTFPETIKGGIAGRRFRMSLFAQLSHGALAVQFGVNVLKSDGNHYYGNKYFANAGAADWTAFSVDLTFPETAAELQGLFFRVYSREGETDWARFTEIRLQDVTDLVAAEASASAAASSASAAATSEGNAGTAASASQSDRVAAQTARGAAEVAQQAAAGSASDAAGSASVAAAKTAVAARLVSRGDYTNSVFSDWTGPGPAGAIIFADGGASYAKDTVNAIYENALLLSTAPIPVSNRPVLQVRSTSSHVDGERRAADIESAILSVELELVSGSFGGAYLAASWHPTGGGGTSKSQEVKLADLFDDTTGVIRRIDKMFTRPEGYVDGSTGGEFRVFVYGTGSSDYAQNSIRVHRLDYQVLSATAVAVVQQAALVDLQGFAQASVGLMAETAVMGGATQISGIRATSYADPDGSGGSLLELIGDNVVAEGTLSANKLVVGSGRNLLSNTNFANGLSDWSSLGSSGAVGSQSTLSLRPPGSYAGHSYPVLQVYQNGTATSGAADVYHFPNITNDGASRGAPAVPGEWIEASVKVSAHRCAVELRLAFYDAAGSKLSDSDLLHSVDAGSGIAGIGQPELWFQLWGKAQCPANTAFVTICIRKLGTNAGSDSYLMMHKPMLARTHSKATAMTPYSEGGATLITGDQIKTGSISADKIDVETLSITGDLIQGGMISREFVLSKVYSAPYPDIGSGSTYTDNNLTAVDFISPGLTHGTVWAEISMEMFSTYGQGATLLTLGIQVQAADNSWHTKASFYTVVNLGVSYTQSVVVCPYAIAESGDDPTGWQNFRWTMSLPGGTSGPSVEARRVYARLWQTVGAN